MMVFVLHRLDENSPQAVSKLARKQKLPHAITRPRVAVSYSINLTLSHHTGVCATPSAAFLLASPPMFLRRVLEFLP